MKVGPLGKKRLRAQVDFYLDDGVVSGVPLDGTKEMLVQWVKGLLENVDANAELRKLLEE